MWCRPRGGRPTSGCLGVGRQDYPRTAGSRFAGRPYKNSSEIRPKRDGTHRSFVPHDRAGAANHGCSQGKSGHRAFRGARKLDRRDRSGARHTEIIQCHRRQIRPQDA
jgi:hypothetical protein